MWDLVGCAMPRFAPRLPSPMCRSPQSSQTIGSDRKRLGVYLRRLPSQESDAVEKDERGADVPDEWLGCARCLNLLDEIRAENLPVPPDAHNAVMRACSSRVDVVQFLFDDLIKAGKETEASFAAMMQAQLNCGDLDGAKETLQGLLSRPRLRTKLRTCGPLITRLCEVGDDSRTTVGLWERLEMRGVGFTQREYSARLGMHARAGEVNLLQSTLNELLDLSPTPDIETLAAIEASVNEIARNGGGQTADALASAEDAASAMGNTGLMVTRRGPHDANGLCTCCGAQLRVLGLTAGERERVRDIILDRAAARSSSGLEHLQRYREWLRVRPPFDYVLDGPNIAYHKQNFDGGRFDYGQIQVILDTVRAVDPAVRVLVLLPTKYLRKVIPNHTSSQARTNTLTEADHALLDAWRAEGILYECSGNLYDDWYWMYATVAETQSPEPPHPDAVATRVVTNDEMRDHWHELLPVMAFNRWKHAQVAAFEVIHPTDPEEGADGEEEKEAEEAGDASLEGAAVEAAPSRLAKQAPQTQVSTHADAQAMAQSEAGRQEAVTGSEADEMESSVEKLTAVVQPPPLLSTEAQVQGGAWHVPVPGTDPQEWLCFDALGA